MSRDISLLHPILQSKIYQLMRLCKKNGLTIAVAETFRTVAEQDSLYAKGRTKSGSIVTNAKGSSMSSMHQWGVAFDFYRNDGKGAYNDNDGFFTKVGELGQSIGLEWGGAWKSIKDKPHLQLPDWGSTPTQLKNKYKTFDKFKKSWPALRGEETKACNFIVVKESFLRSAPATGNATKVKYTSLDATTKKICKKDKDGWAKIVVGKVYSRRRICYTSNSIWHMTAHGYWVCREYNDTAYTKQK